MNKLIVLLSFAVYVNCYTHYNHEELESSFVDWFNDVIAKDYGRIPLDKPNVYHCNSIGSHLDWVLVNVHAVKFTSEPIRLLKQSAIGFRYDGLELRLDIESLRMNISSIAIETRMKEKFTINGTFFADIGFIIRRTIQNDASLVLDTVQVRIKETDRFRVQRVVDEQVKVRNVQDYYFPEVFNYHLVDLLYRELDLVVSDFFPALIKLEFKDVAQDIASRFQTDNTTWISDDELMIKDNNGSLVKLNIVTGERELLFELDLTEQYGAHMYSLSANQKFLLVTHEVSATGSHGFLAKYDVIDVETGNTIQITGPDDEDELQMAEWGPVEDAMIAIVNGDILYFAHAGHEPIALTTSGSTGLIVNGILDPIHEALSLDTAVQVTPPGAIKLRPLKPVSGDTSDGQVLPGADGQFFMIKSRIIDHDEYTQVAIFDNGQTRYLTNEKFSVSQLLAYREDLFLVYFLANLEDDVESQHLYSASTLEYTDQNLHNSARCLTCNMGEDCLYNDAKFSPDNKYVVTECLGPGILKTEVRAVLDNQLIEILNHNDQLEEWCDEHDLPEVELIRIPVNGSDDIRIKLIVPAETYWFDDHPLILIVTDVSSEDVVTNQFSLDWGHYLASSMGYIVVYIDGATVNHYSIDSIEFVIKHLIDLVGFIDEDKILIIGRALNGYLSSLVMVTSELVNYAVAIAPLVNHTDYEELIESCDDKVGQCDLLQLITSSENQDGKQLMIVHGTNDRVINMHQSMMLINVLNEVGYEYTLKVQALRQQKLNAWQPIFTPKAVLPSLMIIGLAFIPIGIGLLMSSLEVDEFTIDYSDCPSTVYGYQRCADVIEDGRFNPRWPRCSCDIKFTLGSHFESQVYLYYQLENYWQSGRRYASSFDKNQLRGNLYDTPDHECDPLAYAKDKIDGKVRPIIPCGLIANSLFNDTFQLYYHDNGSFVPVPAIESGLTWPVDKENKFKNPANLRDFDKFASPPSWSRPIWALDTLDPSDNGLLNDHLIVWMRVAAFPRFRKLWARVHHEEESPFGNGLPAGQYILQIQYNYPVSGFGGRKLVTISNTSWLGGRELFLGFAYIIVGMMTTMLAVVLFVLHRLYGYKYVLKTYR
ncbi:Cell cycle control protein 50B [Halotydeus destructor]|nr:Cell cycle control protein 50B [Halotydeus destructor]